MSGTRATQLRVEYARGYLGLALFAEAAAELERIAADEQGLPVVRSMRIDLHLAKKQWKKAVVVAAELAGGGRRGVSNGATANRELRGQLLRGESPACWRSPLRPIFWRPLIGDRL